MRMYTVQYLTVVQAKSAVITEEPPLLNITTNIAGRRRAKFRGLVAGVVAVKVAVANPAGGYALA